MKRDAQPGGFTLLEVLIGLTIFLGVVLPLIRYVIVLSSAPIYNDQKNACAILRGECIAMYKNMQLPHPTRTTAIDNRVYEIICNTENDSILVDWSMSVKKSGKLIATVHGLLYTPHKSKVNQP